MILDYVDKLGLPDEHVAQRGNELQSLDYLAQGLDFLYGQVRRIEESILAALPKDKRVFIFGNAPELEKAQQGLVACAFHWYAVSVCNYVRLVGWLTHNGDVKKADEYVEHIIPVVIVWRNKVAAHFSITRPRKEDTPADLAMSVIFPISFYDNAFNAGFMKLSIGQNGKSSSSRNDMRWSLTQTHRELEKRYWPN